jgi:homoserine kinase type II
LDPDKANELFELADRLSADAAKLRAELEIEFMSGQLADVVARDYDLGDVVGVDQIFGGYVNLSFAVRTRDADGEHRYFVRKYNKAITEGEIRFEHALVNHINAKGFHLAARVYPNKGGETFVTRQETSNGERLTRFFAVYEMLEGEDKYTWVKNRCTDREYESGGRVLAQFHYLAHDFDPRGLGRQQPPIMQLLRDLRPAFAGYAERARAGGSVVDEYYLEWLPAIDDALRNGAEQEPELRGMPNIPVHCDYHPGNLKWVDQEAAAFRPVETSGSSCSGLFDFDWSKLDYRIFDVAEGVVYFCSSWEGRDSGELWLDKAAIFVRAYQDEAARFAEPGAMTAAELAALPRMIANANLYVLNWDVSAYYQADEDLNDDEYLMYLKHQVMLMEFIEAHLQELAHLADAQGAMGSPGEPGHGHDQERV